MISLKKVNNSNITPIKLKKIDNKNIKGIDLLPLYPNVYICAKKNSGKSTIINHILKHCINKNSNLYFFVSTIFKDPSYKEMLKMLDKKDINYKLYTSIMEDKKNNLEEILDNLEVEESDDESESDEETEIKHKIRYINFGDEIEEETKYKYKPKKICAKHIFIFDDVSAELGNKYISFLLKRNRHFKSKVIISSQYLHDLKPESIMNLDIMMIGKAMPEDKIKIIYQKLDLAIDFEMFKTMYDIATNEKFNFFKIDIRNEKYYKNFDKEFIIE